MLRGRAKYFELVKVLGFTDFKLRFNTSILGYIWSILKPLGIFFVLYIVFGYFIFRGGGPRYKDKLLLGIFIWSYFAEASTAGIQSLLGKSHIIGKIYFPRSIAVLATSLNYAITFIINMAIITVFFMIDRVGFNRYSPLFLLYIAELYLIIMGISFLLSVVYLKFRDIVEIWTILITAGFYATPIIYPIEMVPPRYQKLLYLNPITFIVEYSKRVMVEGRIVDAAGSAHMFLVGNCVIFAESVLLFIAGFLVFRRMSPRAAEYL
ncbi:MAG: ABC transporter permease [Candidatus Aureabacteria bacterium]|nr:ABC transporter permease [Candidatus Auribacterota bacterium]